MASEAGAVGAVLRAIVDAEGWRWFAALTPLSSVADFKKLEVWQKAHALALCIDRTRKTIRASEYTSLRNQIFTAALSIPANIAEGRRKGSEKEFARYLSIAIGSASELESHLIFARDAELISENDFVSLVSQTIVVRKMLYSLIKRLSGSYPPTVRPTPQ